MDELEKEIRNKIAELQKEKQKWDESSWSVHYDVAISNYYIALSNLEVAKSTPLSND